MNICDYELCSGCSLCAAVCPRKAVTMTPDTEGFLRPVVDCEKCVECGVCTKKCPANNREDSAVLQAYAAYSKNTVIRENSSSGGIFAHFARSVLSEGGVVCGAAFNSEMKVVHRIAETEDELWALMGSKYVQSDVSGVYSEIEKHLRENRTVLFSGTPCQCAGIKSAFGKYKKLILVDFICHGVPSPKLFERFIGENFEDVEKVSFRDKKRGWDEFSMRVDSKEGEYNVSRYNDPYIRMFLENVNLRLSCHNCNWKAEHFASDITIGDFWGVFKMHPHMNDNRGTSLVIVRTEKGEQMFNAISPDIRFCKSDLKQAVSSNAMYFRSTPLSPRREEFFKRLTNGESFKELCKSFGKPISTGEAAKCRIKNTIKLVIGRAVAFVKK